ncbi:hypothetical protein HDZ31DRAFT_60561 [Schizophyllum fasciatum]
MFKRGFLNSEKGRKTISVEKEEPPAPKIERNAQGYDVVTYESTPDPHMPPPNVLADLPPGKTRTVFRYWPRDPNGQVMQKERVMDGWKMTPNGYQLWGATLYDFFRTTPVPGLDGYSLISTSSKLASWMRAHGETYATHELEFAEKEKPPHQVFPCDIGQLIRDRENFAKSGLGDTLLRTHPPILQDRLPYHLLPKKLIVHDPHLTLSVGAGDDREDDDGDQHTVPGHDSDGIFEYRLSLSEAGQRKLEEDAEKARKQAAKEAEHPDWAVFKIQDTPEIPPYVLCIKRAPLPPLPTSIEEAHVYIQPGDLCGEGNHSVVYTVEWELPRWALVGREEDYCNDCMAQAALLEIARRRAAGTSFDKPADAPSATPPADPDLPVIYIDNLELKVQSSAGRGELCEHFRARFEGEFAGEAPRTARVLVCAKLSRQYDDHLTHEAGNYQQFPDWFFEHWSGYNVVKPLQDPTPCGALVPNFYGYYLPVTKDATTVPAYSHTAEDPTLALPPSPSSSSSDAPCPSRALPPNYLSPILLLEHCGTPIAPAELTPDDRQAAAALFLLLAHAGWAQNSVAARNVLVQPGPLREWPLARITRAPAVNSFRLIDFGRARKVERYAHEQETMVMQLFRLGTYDV